MKTAILQILYALLTSPMWSIQGLLYSLLQQCFPAKPTFSVEDIPDLTGKVAIVTGGNTGIGEETVKALLERNAKVYIAARNQQKAEQAIQSLEKKTDRRAIFLPLDLADLSSIKASATKFLSKEDRLHILINNAGVMTPPHAELTAQGYDLQFGTHVLGHFFFTKLLLPALILGAESSPDGVARVVNVASMAHYLANELDFNTFKDGPKRRKVSSLMLYNQSKFGNIMFSDELWRRYKDQGIVFCAVHPGVIESDLFRYTPEFVKSYMLSCLIYPTSYGALTQLWAATSIEGINLGGKYLIPWARIGIPHPGTHNLEIGKQLWEWAEEQVENI